MSDRELRELERRWRETRDEGAGVALLRALERDGRTTAPRLTVAAACGGDLAERLLPAEERPIARDELARVLGLKPNRLATWTVDEDCPFAKRGRRIVCDPVAVVGWRRRRIAFIDDLNQSARVVVGVVHHYDASAARRVALAAVWAAWRVVAEEGDAADPTARRLESIEARVVEGLAGAPGAAVEAAVDPSRAPLVRTLHELPAASAESLLTTSVEILAETVSAPCEDERARLVAAMASALWAIVARRLDPSMNLESVKSLATLLKTSFAEAWRAIEVELVVWALGLGDPVEARVAARLAGPDGGGPVRPTFDRAFDDEDDGFDPRIDPTPKQLEIVRALARSKGVDADSMAGAFASWRFDHRSAESADGRYVAREPTSARRLEDLDFHGLSRLQEELERRPGPVVAGGALAVAVVALEPQAPRPASLEGAAGRKLPFRGRVGAVRPRVSATVRFGDRRHVYEGWVLIVEGEVDGAAGGFAVGVGVATMRKHAFRGGDQISGFGVVVAPSRRRGVDLQRASGLARLVAGEEESGEPPWLGPPGSLPEYRRRGYVRLEPAVEACARCVFLGVLRVEESEELATCEPVCFGSSSCPYRG